MLDMPAVSSSADVTVQMRARRLPQQQRRRAPALQHACSCQGFGVHRHKKMPNSSSNAHLYHTHGLSRASIRDERSGVALQQLDVCLCQLVRLTVCRHRGRALLLNAAHFRQQPPSLHTGGETRFDAAVMKLMESIVRSAVAMHASAGPEGVTAIEL